MAPLSRGLFPAPKAGRHIPGGRAAAFSLYIFFKTWYRIGMVEFYGEVSDYTRRRTDRLKKRYYAKWLAALALLLAGVTVAAACTGGNFWVALAFTLLLAGLAALLYFLPLKKKVEGSLLLRVRVEDGKIAFTQYIGGKEIKKTRRVEAVRRVYKTPFCYYIVFSDIDGASVCERCRLKKGASEMVGRSFGAKVQPKDIPW